MVVGAYCIVCGLFRMSANIGRLLELRIRISLPAKYSVTSDLGFLRGLQGVVHSLLGLRLAVLHALDR